MLKHYKHKRIVTRIHQFGVFTAKPQLSIILPQIMSVRFFEPNKKEMGYTSCNIVTSLMRKN